MKAILIIHNKILDELGNIVEIKLWKVSVSADKPHGFKYSLVYIAKGTRVIGYDNAEGKGDHRHVKDDCTDYDFRGLRILTEDFYNDIQVYKRGKL